MAQTLSCPNCSAPLSVHGDDPTLRCPYCNSSVIVPDAVRKSSAEFVSTSAPHTGGATPWLGSALLSPETRLREIGQFIRSGSKSQAIRAYRETFNVSLNEATQAVEALQAGRPVLMPGASNIGVANAQTESNPSISTAINPQAFTTSTRGITYTLTAPTAPTSFVVYWIRFTLLSLPVAFALTMLGLLLPNMARLAAPVWCPPNYVDAFGQVESSYDSSEDSTGYNLVFNCVDNEGQVTQANGLLAGGTLFGLYAAAGIAVAFGLAALFRYKLVGCLPLTIILIAVPVAFYIYANSIPSPFGNNIMRLFQTGPARSTQPDGSLPSILTLLQGATPTPSYGPATLVRSFGGSSGQTAGSFDDSRQVAVDAQGNIYVADYGGGRIQAFDPQGISINQWQIKGNNVYITGLAAAPADKLYVVFGGRIYQYQPATGQLIGQLANADPNVQVVATSAEGDLVAVSNKALARYDANGKRTLHITNWPQATQSTGPISPDDVALDADGNIYIVDSMANTIFKFDPQGQFVVALGQKGQGAGQFNAPQTLAFDSKGRLYVQDYKGIQVFGADNHLLGLIPVQGLGFDMVVNQQDQLIFMDRNANRVFVYAVP